MVLQQVVKREAIDLLCRAGEVGMNLEQLKVTHHKEWRIFQILTIFEELLIRDIKVLVLAFVLPTKAAALPDIGKALLPLDGDPALFKRERRARLWMRLAQQVTKLKKMHLGASTLREVGVSPLVDKIS